MNLYHWAAAGCLKEYSCGDIIVMAESVDEARQKAFVHVGVWLKDHRSWWFAADGTLDAEMWQDSYDDFHLLLRVDLVAKPDLIESAVIFIRGSE
ncbi:hypothetical protein NKJ04_17590 [Mesorhizobium sp. M0618]|uniref:hypothetical protein n=1 Tax=Mesorhizobium sp. M0618 TaxID=2956972 RepID=UPI00333AE582